MNLKNSLSDVVSLLMEDEPITYRERQDELISRVLNLPEAYISKINNNMVINTSILTNIISKKIKNKEIGHKILKELFLVSELLNINTIDDFIVLMVELMDYHDVHKETANIKVVLTSIYPNGFYSKEIVNDILPCLNGNKNRETLK